MTIPAIPPGVPGLQLSASGTSLITPYGASVPVSVAPTTNTYAAIMVAYNTLVAAGGGVLQFLPVTYNIGANTIPISSNIQYKGFKTSFTSPFSGAPDISIIIGKGTIISGDGTADAFAGNVTAGARFSGYLTSGVLTVTALNAGMTGIAGGTGTVSAGDRIQNAASTINNDTFITSQLTGNVGGLGTYQTVGPYGSASTQTLGSSGTPFTDAFCWKATYLSGVAIDDFAFSNVRRAVACGAFNAQSMAFSRVTNLHIFDSTDIAFDMLNYEHMEISRIFAYRPIHSQRIAGYADAPMGGLGNSEVSHLYSFNSGRPLSKGIILSSVENNPGYPCATQYSFVQNNHYNRTATTQTFSFTTTGDATLITITNAAKFPIGMPVTFPSAGGNGFNGGTGTLTTYFVTYSDTTLNQVRLAISVRGTAISATGTGTLTGSTYGYPHLSIMGGVASSASLTIGAIDIEGTGAMVYIDKMVGLVISGTYIGHSQGENLVVRNSAEVTILASDVLTWDTYSGGNQNLRQTGGTKKYLYRAASMSGNAVLGLHQDGDLSTGGLRFNLAGNGGALAEASFVNTYLGNGMDFTYPGVPMGSRQGLLNSNLSYLNAGSDATGMAVWTGPTGSIGLAMNGATNPAAKGFVQRFKNVGTGPLTVTLNSGSDGFFDGGTSRTAVLTAPTGITPGGYLEVILSKTGTSTSLWAVTGFSNCTFS